MTQCVRGLLAFFMFPEVVGHHSCGDAVTFLSHDGGEGPERGALRPSFIKEGPERGGELAHGAGWTGAGRVRCLESLELREERVGSLVLQTFAFRTCDG